MSETTRIADQLRRAFEGRAWHGPSLLEVLRRVTAAQAASRPIKNAHSIWELVLHIAAWDSACRRRIQGEAAKVSARQNFPLVKDRSEAAWRNAVQQAKKAHEELVQAVAEFPDERLREKVPGKKPEHHTYYYMLQGLAQHELYHTGQIALLKKLV